MKGIGIGAIARDLGIIFRAGAVGGLSDGQLLGRFVEELDAGAFEALVHRHGPMVWGVCCRVLRDRHDAEDAFQATFLVLARKAASVLPREKLGNWLHGVAYQTARKARAMRAKRWAREGQASGVPEPMATSDESRDHPAESLDRELARLPEKYRIAIVLCDLEGKSHKAAARQLGWPVGTVSSRLARARAQLARRLSRPGMALTTASLAFLLARNATAAGLPARSGDSTARAVSLIAADGAMTAGVVSAEVALLTGEVMKMMLLTKIKAATAMLLVASAFAFGGTGLAYRAGADEPAREGSTRRPGDPALALVLAGGAGVMEDDLQRLPNASRVRDRKRAAERLIEERLIDEKKRELQELLNRNQVRNDADRSLRQLEHRIDKIEEKLDALLRELKGTKDGPAAGLRQVPVLGDLPIVGQLFRR